MSDELKHIVRSAFEEQPSESAPGLIWSAIDKELTHNNVDTVVKESFEGQQEKAPELVWERVQDQLDIDRVWIRIADKIRVKRYGSVLRFACVLFILLMPFALDFDKVSVSHSPLTRIEDAPNQSNQSDVTPREIIDTKPHSVESSELFRNQGSTQVGTPPTFSTFASKELNELNEAKEVLHNTVNDISLKTRPLAIVDQSRDLHSQSFLSPQPKRSLGLIIGGVSSLDNTWILDNETRTGFNSESLVDNEFSLASSYGAFAEYPLGRHYSVSAEYLFQSRSIQHLNVYDYEGNYIHKEREISSYKLALMATRYTQPKFNGVSHSTLIRFGGYFSGVKNDLTKIDGVVTNVNSIYKRNDIGLHVELGKRIYLKSFIVEAGLKGEYGLLNLATFESNIPPHLNFTRLVSGGAYVRIGYAL